jgi:hypothetical protein
MKFRSFMIAFSVFIVFSFLFFIVVDSTYAQRGGVSRGGGAGGVSRGGAASSGSFSDTGARSASSAQSSAATRQQTSTTNQAQRQSAQSQNVETRQQGATSRTETRTEAYEDTRHNQPGLWDNPGAVAATGYVAGRAVGAATAPVVVAPPCSAPSVRLIMSPIITAAQRHTRKAIPGEGICGIRSDPSTTRLLKEEAATGEGFYFSL